MGTLQTRHRAVRQRPLPAFVGSVTFFVVIVIAGGLASVSENSCNYFHSNVRSNRCCYMCRFQWYAAHLRLIFHSWIQPEKRVQRNAKMYACNKRLTQIVLSTFHHNDVCDAHALHSVAQFRFFHRSTVLLVVSIWRSNVISPIFCVRTFRCRRCVSIFNLLAMNICNVSVALWKLLGCCERISWLRIVLKTSVLCLAIGRSNFRFWNRQKYSFILAASVVHATATTEWNKWDKINI